MTTIQDIIIGYLRRHSFARERRHKNEAIIAMLLDKYGDPVPTSKLAEFSKDFTSYDRIWRLVLSEHPDLRGQDYADKDIYEQEFQINMLGMESGYHKLKQLELV